MKHQPYQIFVKKLRGINRSTVKIRLTNQATMTVNSGSTSDMVKYALDFAAKHSLKFTEPP